MVTVSAIANSSKTQLLCITYEILLNKLKHISEHIEELRSENYSNKGEIEKDIEQSIRIVKMLANDLDFEFDISVYLFKLYVYVHGILIKNKTTEGINEAYTIIHKLYIAYKEISKNEINSGESMRNAEKIYNGLTYGENKLGKTYTQDFNRGYKA